MKTFTTKAGTELKIMDIKGKDYLPVAQRLVWFREEKPLWGIETSFKAQSAEAALFRAEIRDDTGRVIAVAHKFEDRQGFPDFIEKAETGAIGRALALIGYGTQFCADEFDEGKRIADSPISRADQRIYPSPELPGEGNGNTEPLKYKVRFGKWAQRSLEELERQNGLAEMENYAGYLINAAKKSGKPLGEFAQEYIDKLAEYKERSFEKAAKKTAEIKAAITPKEEPPPNMDEPTFMNDDDVAF